MFISAARAAARTRPVVAIRAGGRLADATGESDEVMEAALRRAGVLRVAGLDDLLAAAETLARVRVSSRPGAAGAGDRIAVVTNGIGLGILASDAALAGGARLARIEDEGMAALAMGLPEGWSGRNPLARYSSSFGASRSSLARMRSVNIARNAGSVKVQWTLASLTSICAETR